VKTTHNIYDSLSAKCRVQSYDFRRVQKQNYRSARQAIVYFVVVVHFLFLFPWWEIVSMFGACLCWQIASWLKWWKKKRSQSQKEVISTSLGSNIDERLGRMEREKREGKRWSLSIK